MTSSEHGRRDSSATTPERGRRILGAAVAALGLASLLLACGLAASISWNRSFQVDEVEHIHSAYNWADGRRIYADFWEGHNPLLYLVLRPLVDGEQPTVTYRRARVLMLAILAGTVLMTAFAAGRLAGPPCSGS
jgi:hypothetical protein